MSQNEVMYLMLLFYLTQTIEGMIMAPYGVIFGVIMMCQYDVILVCSEAM
jgi:hypothetical protein